ncbi:HAD-IA family hydrolase [Salinisphaera sp.]|uniref:HAD-IA family hydrolase n=1 Tax=Salinisphaera sp. TaxID=1914330 RepID=UPI002D779D4E|nr:HAD-IA family hydrolase [Salinisphaera sp.]HET7313425.1 HAD-IA family hydrolase [Salinisphaera sp.]
MADALPFAAVIYDCDGTLVDSELLNARCMVDMITADHGIHLDAVAVEAEFRGGKFADMCDTLSARHGIDLGADFATRYRAHSSAVFERELQVIPGVRAAIEAIGEPRCVASSGPPGKLATALRATGLADYFGDLVFSAYDIESWKPEPDLFLHAAKAMGVAPAQCAVIEDSDPGVEAARRAGMRVFGYDRRRTIGDHPDAALVRFTDFAELPRLLGRG